jgi:glycosyltransferase involved in cell wall biosynthesis
VRILLLNQYYHPDIAATAQLLSDLGESLAARGHQVTAMASARPYAGAGWLPLRERHRGVDIVRVPATALGRARKLGRTVDYASFLAGLTAPLLAGPRPDLVVALSTPPLVAAMGLLLKRLRGTRLVYWVMDVYPDVALTLGALSPGSPVTRLLGSLGRTLYDGADAIVALDDAMRERLVAGGADPARVEVIDNWPPAVGGVDAIGPRDRAANPLRRALHLGDRFTVSYSGNMGLGHDLQTIAQAMRILRDEDMHWLFIGDGPGRATLVDASRALDPARVTFLSYRAREELPDSLTAAHVSLVALDAGLAGLLVPSKLYALLAAGVPIAYVGPASGRVADVIRDHAVGVTIANGDGAGLATALRRLRAAPAEREAMGARARALYEARFTRAHALARHHELLGRVAGC